ncbi:DUF1559 domain-containing protein [bacterium]|nr:DUF1559 domain-containing protein [bacterium]
MSNLPPNQPSPYSAAPIVSPSSSKGGGNSVLIIGLVIGVGVVLLFCGGVLVALLLPAVSNARLAARSNSQMNQTKQVALALLNYHAVHKQLPFTATADENGNVIGSWRMAVAPYVDDGGLYVQGKSQTVPDRAPFCFQPLDPTTPNETDVFVIVSPEGMFSSVPNTPIHFSDVTDRLDMTVMAVRLPNRSADWKSTNELTPDEAFAAIQSLNNNESGFWLMGDGSVTRIELPLDRKTFDTLITRGGGEPAASF